ncbi:helix-turn-helix domain-containing protein [Streptococcus suis]|uniref:helix-turn-helix domain-containing protein n=1 Tax=Streptococcus suis TaxID=1307 RepID=UPI000C18B5A7|nr:helix-turn-helix transcriptional regulator [Streptococcus suis]AUC91190.1 XRE family transcriptional regulator [Streptococcus suis]
MEQSSHLQFFIAHRIKTLRLERKLSQEKLSEKAGLGAKYIFNIENKNYNIRIQTLEKIIAALEVSYEEFFEFEYPLTENPSLQLLETLSTLPKEKQSALLTLFNTIILTLK